MTNKLNTPWMNEVTLNSLIKKRNLWTTFKYCKNPLNKSNYDEAKRSANYHVRQAKYEYERSITTNMKEHKKIFWKFIQSKTKSKENIPCIMDENGEVQMDNKIKAELLNKFFQSVFTIEDTTQGIPIFPPRTDQKLKTIEFDIQKVQEYLEKLKETKLSGPD